MVSLATPCLIAPTASFRRIFPVTFSMKMDGVATKWQMDRMVRLTGFSRKASFAQ
jgi:hypothetical protein